MVCPEKEVAIRNTLRPHIVKACEELAEADIVDVWWPEGFAERMAIQLAQSIALMSESAELGEEQED